MSREIDERIVQMKFESGQFEKNVQTSIHSLDELKKGLDFKDAVKGFEKIDGASKSVKLDPLTAAVAQLNSHFNLLGITAFNVMNRISNMAINTGEALIRSLTIEQVNAGWDKFATKTSSVQTIMAATAKQFSDTSVQMGVVNEQLDRLNWFTDETSYNFVDMVNNIGKFTSNNIDLETSVTAMQGIANWAAKSGANANEASRAMYNLSQAIATGAVKLIDWKSIENANMATAEFKEMALQTAEELGTLKKVGEGTFTTLDGKVQILSGTFKGFNDSLQKGWFSKDVLMKTLDNYGKATNRLNEIYQQFEGNVATSDIISYVDDYTEALNKARKAAEKQGLTAEESAKKAKEAGKEVAEAVAEDWGISLEEATKILEEFDDEIMQFGLKAFKAGQEAKTFSDAIDSVKDAVSTGWMKSFEYMFGDYQEAKEFWTNIANTLYSIFAEGGNARNEMLKDWKAQGGQKYFTDAIYAGLAAIVRILTPIKAAWESVFGKMSSNQLLELTKRLRDFFLRLSASQKTMQQIARVARGFFSIIDMGKTIITQFVKGALETMEVVLNELGIDFGEIAAGAGDFLFMLSRWLRQTNVITNAFKLLQNALVLGIRKVKEFLKSLQDWGPVQKAISAFQKIFTSDFKGMGGIAEAFGNVMSWLWERLKSFRFPSSLSEVGAFFSDFAKIISENLENAGIDLSGFTDGLKNFGGFIKYTLGQINADFSTFAGVVKAAFGVLGSAIGQVDWAGVLLAAFGVATLAIMWKFTDALNTFAGAVKNVTKVGSSIQGAFNSIKGYFDALKGDIETNNLLKTAIAITALAVAFGLIAQLDWKKIALGSGVIIVLTACLAGMTVVLDKFMKNRAASEGPKGGVNAITSFLISMAAAIALISISFNAVKIDNTMGQKMLVFVGVLTALTVASAAFSWIAKDLSVSAFHILAISASVVIMINALKHLSEQDTSAILGAIAPIGALMAALALLGRLMTVAKKIEVVSGGKKNTIKQGGAFLNVIGLVFGVSLLISSLKRLGNMDPGVAYQGLKLMVPIVSLFAALLLAVNKASKHAANSGKMILAMAIAANLMVSAIRNFAKMSAEDLVKGGIVVSGLMALMGAITVLFANIAGNKGQFASKAGLMILQFAGSLMLIQLVVKTLGRMDPLELAKGVAAVSVLIIAMGAAIAGVNKFKADAPGLKALTKLTIIIGMIMGVFTLLSLLDPAGALVVGIGLSAVFASLAVALRVINTTAENVNLKPIANLVKYVAIMGAIIAVICAVADDWKTALAVIGGMSLLVIALGTMNWLVSKSTGGLTEAKWKPMAKMVAAMAGVVAAFALINKIIIKGKLDAKTMATLSACLSGIMVAFGLMSGIMGSMKGKPDDKNIKALLKMIRSMSVIVMIFAGVAGLASKAGASISDVIYLASALSVILVSFGAAARLMDGVKGATDLTELGIVTALISGFVMLLSVASTIPNLNPVAIAAMSGSVGEILLSMAIAAKIMDKTDFNITLRQIGPLLGLAAGIVSLLSILSACLNIDTTELIVMSASVSVIMLSLAAAVKIMNKTNFDVAADKIVALVGMAGLLSSLFGVLSSMKDMDYKAILTMTGSMSLILLSLSAAVRIMNGTDFTIDVKKLSGLVGLCGGIVVIFALLSKVLDMDTGRYISLLLGFSGVLLAAAASIRIMNNTTFDPGKSMKPITIFIGEMAAIVAGLALLSTYVTRGGVSIADMAIMVGSISVLMLAIAKSMKIMDQTSGGLTKQKLVPMGAMVAELALIIGILANQSQNMQNMDYAAFASMIAGLSAIMVAFGEMSKLMGSMSGKPTMKNIVPILAIVGSLGLVVAAFAGISNGADVDWDEMISMSGSMSILMLAVGEMAKIMNDVKAPEDMGSIAGLIGMMTVMSIVIGILSGILDMDWKELLGLSGGISLILVALSGAVKIMDGAHFELGYREVGVLSLLVAALGGVLALFTRWVENPNNLVPFAVALVPLLLGVAGAAVILSKFNGNLAGATKGVIIAIEIISMIGVLIAALGALEQMTGGSLSSWLEDGASMMISLGEGIGGFVGGIVGGLAKGLTDGFKAACENIADGISKLSIFFDVLANIPDDSMDKVQLLFDCVTRMVDPAFKNGLQGLKWVADQMTGGSESLQTIFSEFALAIAAFGQSLGTTNAEQVKMAVDAACELARLEAGLPGKGGVFSDWLFGDDDLTTFGERLKSLGSALWQFGTYGKLIDQTAVDNAITAATKLQKLEDGLPPKDGILQTFLGQSDLELFGARLRMFGSGLVAFSNACLGSEYGGGIDMHAIENGVTAGTKLKDLEGSLPTVTGIFASWFLGNNDLYTFGERLKEFGGALADFSKSVSGENSLDMTAIGNAVKATGDLAELEKKLDTSGGWNAFWNGDSTFSQFGTNLKALGTAISSFAQNIASVNWANITTAIAFINDLTAVEKLEDAANRTLVLSRKLMRDVLDIIKNQEVPMRDRGKDMAKWVVEGFAEGTNEYAPIALTAAISLANSIIAIMNSIFKIHSPSVVMNEMGHWVVKGLGEGITEDMSAEQAAEQKAQNVISAFQNALSRMDLKLTVSNLEYEVWTKTEGKKLGENDPMLVQKQLENEVSKLEAAAQKAGMLQTAMAAVLETAGEESTAYLNARQNYLEALSAMYDQQATVDELQGTNLKNQNQSWADQTKLFAQLQAENAEAFKMMGKSEEELRDWAAKQVGDSFARSLQTNDLMQEYKDTFDRLGYSQEERLEKVNEMLGPETITKMENTIVDTNAIIDNALKEQKYDLEEIIAENVSSAIRGAGGGSGGAAIGAASEDLGGSVGDAIASAFEQIEIPEIEMFGLDNLDEALGDFGDPAKWFEKAQSLFTSDTGFLGGLRSSADSLVEGGKEVIGDVFSYVSGEEAKDTATDAAHTLTETYSEGLGDQESKDYAKKGAEGFATAVTDSLNDALKSSNSEGTIGTDAANQVAADFVSETERQTPLIETAISTAGAGAVREVNTAATNAENEVSKTVPQYKVMGQQMMQGLQKGIKENAYLAINEAQTQANKVAEIMAAALEVNSPSKVTERIGMSVTEGLAKGIGDHPEWVTDASENLADTTIDALTQAKTLIGNVLSDDDNLYPTITPVLDLDQLTADSKQIPGLLNRNTRLNVSGTARRVNALNQSFGSNRQNGSDESVVTNYNMVQNNYSPKALNRSEIYRQTKNQFSQLKGATQVR